VAPAPIAGRKRLVGKIWADISVTNRGDQVLVERGFAAAETVRSKQVRSVLVDTGATNLCLPADLITELGLPLRRIVEVETATGITSARMFHDAVLTVEGRTGIFECLELPGGKQPLLGVIPLEALGIDLDLANERMVLRPDWGEGTYLSIL
jgi:predicted aspartyl protease